MGDTATVTDWVTAIATSLAVVIALGVALSEPWRQRRGEERTQARAVHAWVAEGLFPVRDVWELRLYNGSSRPVFDMEIDLLLLGPWGEGGQASQTYPWYRDAVLPGEPEPWRPEDLTIKITDEVRGTAEVRWKGRFDSTCVSEGGEPWVINAVRIVRFTFTDADSRRWTVKNGKLTRA